MARGVRIDLTLSQPASEMVDALLATGLFGRTRAEVAQRLLYAELRRQLEAGGFLRERPPRPRKK